MRIEARNGGTGGGGHRQRRQGQPLMNGEVTGMSHHDAQTTIYINYQRDYSGRSCISSVSLSAILNVVALRCIQKV